MTSWPPSVISVTPVSTSAPEVPILGLYTGVLLVWELSRDFWPTKPTSLFILRAVISETQSGPQTPQGAAQGRV